MNPLLFLMNEQILVQIQLELYHHHFPIQNVQCQFPKKTWFKFLPKQNQLFNCKGSTDSSKFTTLLVQNLWLPRCSSVNPNPNDHSVDPSVNNEIESPVKEYSKQITPFLRQHFRTGLFDFQLSLSLSLSLSLCVSYCSIWLSKLSS